MGAVCDVLCRRIELCGECQPSGTVTSEALKLAYNSSGSCQWFQYGDVSEVAQGTKAQGKIVAFKVISSGSCPDGSDPPTFGQTAHGYLETIDYRYIPINVNYTITSTGTSWSFSFESEIAFPHNLTCSVPVKNSCPPGEYAFSPRPAGDWCIQTLYSNVSLSYQQALDACQSVDKSTLTGAVNAAEAQFFIGQLNEPGFDQTRDFQTKRMKLAKAHFPRTFLLGSMGSGVPRVKKHLPVPRV